MELDGVRLISGYRIEQTIAESADHSVDILLIVNLYHR